jgi:hypothetical protein
MDAVISSGGGEVTENITEVVMENVLPVQHDATLGSQKGASEGAMLGAKTQKNKGTTTFALDFDE